MLRFFRDERGSTALTAVVAVVLAVTLMALSLQWYWVRSSSSDIQTLADFGALAGADAVAKVSTTIQVLDAILLSMNVVGLMLHATVLVGGVAVAVSAPVGGVSLAPLLSKLVQFNKKYLDVRKNFAQGCLQVADYLNRAAPYLALAQSWEVIRVNSARLNNFNGVIYTGAAIPFPVQGSVSLSGYPDELDDLAAEVGDAGEENRGDAAELADLERRLEGARAQCYELDAYRPPGGSLVGWVPEYARDDYLQEVQRQANLLVPAPESPPSIEGSVSANQRLAECFERDYVSIGEDVADRFERDAYRVDGDGYLAPSTASVTSYLDSYSQQTVLLVPHDDGERKAYHDSGDCFGLYSAAAEPDEVALSSVSGDHEHPPCSLCTPTHWGAIQQWEATLGPFAASWSTEVAAIGAHEDIRREVESRKDSLTERTTDVLENLAAHASAYLLGGRLTYNPSGSRGFLCVVVGNSGRKLPAFTLPSLTGTASRKLGSQVGLSGARVVQTEGQHAIVEYLNLLVGKTSPGSSAGMSGAVNGSLGQADGVAAATNPLWKACLGQITGTADLRGWFSQLPWGLDSVASRFVGDVLHTAGVGPPDLRQLAPVLVATTRVGDPAAAGPEGQIVAALRQAQSAFVSGATVLPSNIGDELYSTIIGEAQSAYPLVFRLFTVTLMGKALEVPFSSSQLTRVNESISWVRGNMGSVLAAISGEAGN